MAEGEFRFRCLLCNRQLPEKYSTRIAKSGATIRLHFGCETQVQREGWKGNAAVCWVYDKYLDSEPQEAPDATEDR